MPAKSLKHVDIYTDGACSGNPGEGGWAAILIYNGFEKVVSGYNKETTNNRMEVFAVIMGLRQLKERCNVTITSDSTYVVDTFLQNRIDNWKKNNWRTAAKDDVKNVDLWKSLLFELDKHEFNFVKVKGHSDNEYNNRCDKLARDEIKKGQNGR